MIGAGLVSAGPTDRQTIYTAASLDQPLDLSITGTRSNADRSIENNKSLSGSNF